MMDESRLSRREFLIRGATLGLTCAGFSLLSSPSVLKAMSEPAASGPLDLAIAKGGDPSGNTIKAIETLGGIGRFVKKDNKVVVKPNPCTPNRPEIASTTNPAVVETVVAMCLEAGAREVVVLSHDSLSNFERNGIMEAASRTGARVVAAVTRDLYESVPVLRGRVLQEVEIARDVLDADVFINMPIAKHHSETGLTLSMKNLMGINWDRGYFHQHGLQQAIADLSTAVKPALIVMDANRILLTNGPSGPGETRDEKAVIAGTDPVAVDAYTATLFGRNPEDIGHIRYAYELGVGEMNVEKLRIKEESVH